MKGVLWVIKALVLGALIALIAGGVYRFIEWRAADTDPHDRGLWEGVVIVFVFNSGYDIARKILNRKAP